MSTWIIGDLHGCAASFRALRDTLNFDETRDTLVLVGDLVNRGSGSLETLRWIVEHKHCVRTVLGNHDIHLLWCALGSGTPHGRDTLLEILQAPDAHVLIQWLRAQPFAQIIGDAVTGDTVTGDTVTGDTVTGDALVLHAGIHPHWRVKDALHWSDRLQAQLQAPDAGAFLDRMREERAEHPDDHAAFEAMDVFTRMRVLERSDLSLNTTYSNTLENIPEHLVPWFRVQSEHPRPRAVFSGHWAALGFHQEPPYIALDSGCVWGNGLTAWRLEDGHHVFQPAIDPPVTQSDGQRSEQQRVFPKQQRS